MTHEPECESLQDTVVLPADCWICHLTKAAYQRGREDAAESVRAAAYDILMIGINKPITWETIADMAIAAARGDGDYK